MAKGGKNPQEVTADNGGYLVTAGETVASGQTLTWEVVVTVSVDPSVPGYSDDSLACATDPRTGLLQEESRPAQQAGHQARQGRGPESQPRPGLQ